MLSVLVRFRIFASYAGASWLWFFFPHPATSELFDPIERLSSRREEVQDRLIFFRADFFASEGKFDQSPMKNPYRDQIVPDLMMEGKKQFISWFLFGD
jgi:hypothetical protein